MAASGTVLLELAILGVPTVATYRVSPMTYRLGRLLIRGIKYFSLVNLIGERAIIPELLQDEVTPQRIAQEMAPLLEESAQRNLMLDGFNDVKTRLGGPGASERAAMVAFELLDTPPFLIFTPYSVSSSFFSCSSFFSLSSTAQ